MKHEAVLVPGSIEDLGHNGIAFSVMCCGDAKNVQRHTIQHAHAMSTDDLLELIRREYLTPHAEAHYASSAHAEHLQKLAESHGLVGTSEDCQGCK